MLFGDPADFAIEAMTEPHLVAPAVMGRMRVHIGPLALGDLSDQNCGLEGAYCGFKALLKTESRLWDESFAGLTHEQIHDLVHQALYGDDERTKATIKADIRRYRRFDFLTHWGRQFAGYGAVIVQPDEQTTTILHRPSSNSKTMPKPFVSASCTTTGFRAALAALVTWFDNQAADNTPPEA